MTTEMVGLCCSEPFTAVIDDAMRPLFPEKTRMQKVARAVWNGISVVIPLIGIVRVAAKWVVLPSAKDSAKKAKQRSLEAADSFREGDQRRHSREFHTVITPDGAALEVKVLKDRLSDQNTPTIIFFNANAEYALYSTNPLEATEAKSAIFNKPCNFVYFDYRGVGASKGKFRETKDLVVDGLSIVQFVRQRLETQDQSIHFYGRSLGGAVATLTKAQDPRLRGRIVNERSFSSLDAAIQAHVGCVLSKPVGGIFKLSGYNLDVADAFNSLNGEKCIIYHKEDRIVPPQASLIESVDRTGVRVIDLSRSRTSSSNHHNFPLHKYAGLDVPGQIAAFLLPGRVIAWAENPGDSS